MFRKLLIANRGEIACRIAKTARRLGVATAAVYSKADSNSLHVTLTDEAWPIGGPTARESYLDIDRIIAAALESGAQAVHPGYGFLAENAEFAERCLTAGLVFVGPPPQAMRLMGAKASAKAMMARAGVPVVPGDSVEYTNSANAQAAVDRIGYPVLIKASAGGGGRGMRIVTAPGEFAEAFSSAEREAIAAFGDGRLILEKYLRKPCHIEVQIFADTHGGVVAFAERDCSMQRHHQKVLEETPAHGLPYGLAQAMREAGLAAAQAVGYVGAGTVEFLVVDDKFYFLEMNTRLQVEHPITEMIAGVDLVEWQLRIAAGEKLPLTQDAISTCGCAMEARICAEDPSRDFLPAIGRIEHYRPPEGDVRVDAGVRQGDRVTQYYDSLIAKLVVHGADRPSALRNLQGALAAFELVGVTTNLDFLRALAEHPAFVDGGVDTGFIEREVGALTVAVRDVDDLVLLAAAAAAFLSDVRQNERSAFGDDPFSPWALVDGWRLFEQGGSNVAFRFERRTFTAKVYAQGDGAFWLETSSGKVRVEFEQQGVRMRLRVDGVMRELAVVRRGENMTIVISGRNYFLEHIDPLKPPEQQRAIDAQLSAPVPARVTRVLIRQGERVLKGAALVVLEAMKMEFTIAAPREGVIESLRCMEGEQVKEGLQLVVLREEAS